MDAPVRIEALPPADAIAYFRSKGMAPPDARFDWRDVWQDQHAAMFVVAKAVQEEVAQTLRAALLKQMEGGATLAGFQDAVRPELERLGWWGRKPMRDPLTGDVKDVQLGSMRRLRVIFDTNMRTAQAAGRWAGIERTKRAFPYLRYVQIDRPSRRAAHRPLNGLVRPVDDPVWDQIYPPNGFFCGCTVFRVTQGQIDRGEYSLSPPASLTTVSVPNPRRAVDDEVPVGIDPGFASNPGRVWLDMQSRMQGLAGHPNAAVLQGLGAQLRLNVLREGLERGVYVQPDGRLLAPVQASRERPASLSAIDPQLTVPPGSDFIHSHPFGSPLSRADLLAAQSHKLANVIAVTPQGGVFAASPQTDDVHRLARAIDRFHRTLALPWASSALHEVPVLERGWLIDHGRLLWLERAGVIDYLWDVPGAQRDLFSAHAAFFEDLLSDVP